MSGALARIVDESRIGDQSASSHPEDARHILADSSLTDEPIRVLKHGDTFALFDQYGDIRPGKDGEQGIYHDGTRYLSRLELRLEGARPFLLSSTSSAMTMTSLTVALTNPDLCRDDRVYLPLGSLHLGFRKVPLARSLLSGAAD